jgi:hypothetical protein
MREHEDYIGDGVYVAYEHGAIWLMANSHVTPTDTICLEPEVLQALIRYAERIGIRTTENPLPGMCTVCHVNPVDVDAGFDTCEPCRKRI